MIQQCREDGVLELGPQPFWKMVGRERLRWVDILFRGAALSAGGLWGRCGFALDVDDID